MQNLSAAAPFAAVLASRTLNVDLLAVFFVTFVNLLWKLQVATKTFPQIFGAFIHQMVVFSDQCDFFATLIASKWLMRTFKAQKPPFCQLATDFIIYFMIAFKAGMLAIVNQVLFDLPPGSNPSAPAGLVQTSYLEIIGNVAQYDWGGEDVVERCFA
ncbi:hypothetical protein OGAPHI_004837 [Ogataea philodendri]|uniref:Uncharacterized protein n=1 Tax=Ogataea philodendri TaxID=1378263 RepID=A0A9P8P234_9ASCO|nr:uncharacterized protein OGAPHI_004837 [Ogataea philodendri]KAH3664123.1 hypothetical protein OGAPHI_004837 [Ogataea philodendri]